MPNPTCPLCQHLLTARDAIPFMGQVAILLECDYWHQTVEIVPVSRFNPGFNWRGYDELVQDTEIAWQAFLALVTPESDLMAILESNEMIQFKRVRDISNEYYEAWQG